MADVIIRLYQPTDLETCRALWAELTERHRDIYADPSIGGAEPGLHFDQHLARAGPEHLWVAECAGEVVGLTGLIVADGEAEVEPLVVASGRRGQGIGQALVKHTVVEAHRLGVRYLSVRPVARNVEAIGFFYDAGFQTLGHLELFMDLRPSAPAAWKPGPELFGCCFRF